VWGKLPAIATWVFVGAVAILVAGAVLHFLHRNSGAYVSTDYPSPTSTSQPPLWSPVPVTTTVTVTVTPTRQAAPSATPSATAGGS